VLHLGRVGHSGDDPFGHFDRIGVCPFAAPPSTWYFAYMGFIAFVDIS
jgi:hypothetical protein